MRFPRSVIALGLSAVMVVAACGSSSSSPSASGAASPSSSAAAEVTPSADTSVAPGRSPILSVSPDQLIFPDRLLICADLPYPPMRFFDDAGNPTGAA